jgi:outer membrane immunogenic protein
MNPKTAASVALVLGMSLAGASVAASPFNGPYVGAQLGYSLYDFKVTTPTESFDGASGRGADGGVYAGWGTLFSPAFYGGVEAEYNWSGAKHQTTLSGASGEIKDKDNYGIGARLGWLPSSNAMLYTRLGWQRAQLEYSGNVVGTGGTISGSTKLDHNGFRLGVGAETALAANTMLRLEYDHTWYRKDTVDTGLESEPRNDLFRVGLAYQF